MIDSHCHLDHEPLFKNIVEVLNRSKKVGIKKLLTICTTIDGFKNIEDILILRFIILSCMTNVDLVSLHHMVLLRIIQHNI